MPERATRAVPDFDRGTGAAPGAELADRHAQMAHAYEPRATDAVLRALDLLIAATSLLLLSPVLALCAALVIVVDGRPVLYRGLRVGRFGQPFAMFKLRTLRRDAEARLGAVYGEELTTRTREETIFGGAALRALHIDEIPQLFNVIRGEMSMVGPRPIRPAFYEQLIDQHPLYWQRLVVRPGVTGFAQTRITREDLWPHKLAHDLEYIADRSVGLYLRVLGATMLRIARRLARGAPTRSAASR